MIGLMRRRSSPRRRLRRAPKPVALFVPPPLVERWKLGAKIAAFPLAVVAASWVLGAPAFLLPMLGFASRELVGFIMRRSIARRAAC